MAAYVSTSTLFDKVPSPSGSDDSGLGLSPRPLSADFRFPMDSPEKLNFTLGSYCDELVEACSPPYTYDETKLQNGQFDAPSIKNNAQDNQFFNEQLPTDLSDLACFNDLFDSSLEQADSEPLKIAIAKGNCKKRNSTKDNSLKSKIERCLLPKTGNGKPRQTSQKRKLSQNKNKRSYPGVRVETVRQRLDRIRRQQTKGFPRTPSSSDHFSNVLGPCPLSPPLISQTQPYSPTSSLSPGDASMIYPSERDVTSPQLSSPKSVVSADSMTYTYESASAISPQHPAFSPEPAVENIETITNPALSPSTPTSYTPFSPVTFQQPSPSQCGAIVNMTSPPNVTLASTPTLSHPGSASPTCYTPPIPTHSTYESCQQQQQQGTSLRQSFYGDCVPCQDPEQDLTSLFESAYHGCISRLQAILYRRPDFVNRKDSAGKTPLFYAIKNNQLASVRLLLQRGASPAHVLPDGTTSLHFAASCPTTDIMELLLGNLGAKLLLSLVNECIYHSGVTPLHIAAEAGNVKTMALLLQCRANAFAQEKKMGLSPLHIAVKNADVDAVRTLIDFTKRHGLKVVQQFTCQKAGDDNTALHFAAELPNLRHAGNQRLGLLQRTIIKLLLDHHADPFARNYGGELPGDMLPPNGNCYELQKLHQLLPSALQNGPEMQNNLFYSPCAVDFNCASVNQGARGLGYRQ